MALCGGVGKSTLLDILAGRQTTGALSGVVALNGVRCKKLGRSGGPAAYVPQVGLQEGRFSGWCCRWSQVCLGTCSLCCRGCRPAIH